jgi:hypothetical protein
MRFNDNRIKAYAVGGWWYVMKNTSYHSTLVFDPDTLTKSGLKTLRCWLKQGYAARLSGHLPVKFELIMRACNAKYLAWVNERELDMELRSSDLCFPVLEQISQTTGIATLLNAEPLPEPQYPVAPARGRGRQFPPEITGYLSLHKKVPSSVCKAAARTKGASVGELDTINSHGARETFARLGLRGPPYSKPGLRMRRGFVDSLPHPLSERGRAKAERLLKEGFAIDMEMKWRRTKPHHNFPWRQEELVTTFTNVRKLPSRRKLHR